MLLLVGRIRENVSWVFCGCTRTLLFDMVSSTRQKHVSRGLFLISFRHLTSERSEVPELRKHTLDPLNHNYTCTASLICQEAFETQLLVRFRSIKAAQQKRDLDCAITSTQDTVVERSSVLRCTFGWWLRLNPAALFNVDVAPARQHASMADPSGASD